MSLHEDFENGERSCVGNIEVVDTPASSGNLIQSIWSAEARHDTAPCLNLNALQMAGRLHDYDDPLPASEVPFDQACCPAGCSTVVDIRTSLESHVRPKLMSSTITLSINTSSCSTQTERTSRSMMEAPKPPDTVEIHRSSASSDCSGHPSRFVPVFGVGEGAVHLACLGKY